MDSKTQLDNVVELKDLVYAPLQAISAANIRLSSNVVDFLASTGDMGTDANGNPVVQLRTIQMQYEQLRNDADDSTVADCIGLEIPLLSVYPLSSLKVSKTKVTFDAEIKNVETVDGVVKVYTQVCSKKEREGANQPRLSYEVQLESLPISEGLARFVDTLNAQVMPKRLYSKPLDSSGKKLVGKDLENYSRRKSLSEREADVSAKLNEVKEIIRSKNNMLKLETGMDYDEYREHVNDSSEEPSDSVKEICSSIEEYRKLNNDLENRLERIRRKLLLHKVEDKSSESIGL